MGYNEHTIALSKDHFRCNVLWGTEHLLVPEHFAVLLEVKTALVEIRRHIHQTDSRKTEIRQLDVALVGDQ